MPFFDNLKAQADKAQFEANRMMRVNSVQTEINGLKTQLQARRDELSFAVYEQFKAGQITDPKLVSICEALQTLDNAVTAKQRDIENIKAEKAPGTAPAAQPTRAQAVSTTAAPSPVAPPAGGAVYGHICPKENIPLPANVMFCPNCGSKAIDVPAPAPAAPVAAAKPNVCSNCGTQLEPNAMFCPNCGTKVSVA